MIAKVFHLNWVHPSKAAAKVLISGNVLAAEVCWEKGIYSHVADVTIYGKHGSDIMSALERTFHLTNSIDHGWWENEDVELTNGEQGARSTSVGDVVHYMDKLYVVQSAGFKEITDWS